MNFKDIPQLPQAHYNVHVPWRDIERILENWGETWVNDNGEECGGVDLSPDYQRAHVWTPEQQIAYVEYVLMGGEVGSVITWNNPTWMGTWKDKTELIDGKQRLQAVRSFLSDKITAFDTLYSEYEGRLSMTGPRFEFRMCKLKTRNEILQLYLNINAGGTPHTKEELDKVRKMLRELD